MRQRAHRWTKDRLAATAADSSSYVDMLRRLAQPLGSEPLRYLRARTAHYGIDTRHFVEEPLPARARQHYTEEVLRDAAEHCDSLRNVLEYLGVAPYGSAYGYLARRFERFGIEISHFAPRADCLPALDEQRVRAAVERARSIADVIRDLGLAVDTTSRRAVRRAIEAYGLSTAHFAGQGHNRGCVSPTRKSADALLRRLPEGARRTRREQLHRALQEKRVPYRCQACGLGERWQGRVLVLEIDHLNGDRLDNRIGNLRYLCPSCHSQTATHARGRSVGSLGTGAGRGTSPVE